MQKIRVFVIDDSAIVRELLTKGLNDDPRIEVVGSAIDPLVARDKLAKVEADVLTLDVEMPRMDGLTFLGHLMRQHPMPVVVVSSIAESSNDAGIRALELGAAGIVPKPGGPFSVEEVIELLADSIVKAATTDPLKLASRSAEAVLPDKAKAERRGQSLLSRLSTTNKLIAMGASTGGTQAYEAIFRMLPEDIPPIVAAIHMPAGFTASFARRLDELCLPAVREAKDGDPLVPGTIYIAPGGFHLAVRASGAKRVAAVFPGPKVWNQRPAVDVLFESVAGQVGQNAVGVLLTGMGHDGAKGLLQMRQAGARTICQDEASCIVFGMPKSAIDQGAAEQVVALDRVAAAMLEAAGA